MARPGPLQDPPPDLGGRRLSILEKDSAWYRTHSIQRQPVFYGKAGLHRFDAPDQSYGVLYAAQDPYCAFIETFGHSTGINTVTTEALAARALSLLQPSRALRLVDLTDSGSLARIGADARLFAADTKVAQKWSRALYIHPARADGILYPARHDPARGACAIFDRAPKLVAIQMTCWWVDEGPHRQLLAGILDHYGFSLIETQSLLERKPPRKALQPTLFE